MQLISIKRNLTIYSEYLKRDVVFDIILPAQHFAHLSPFKLLFMNDGQDLAALQMEAVLESLYSNNQIKPFVLAAIHTNHNRLKEYGTSAMPDYKNRGNLAGKYEKFIINEFLPFVQQNYHASTLKEDHFFCGFSLGGLSAMDIVWSNPDVFSKVGVFSGSFWWRKKAYEDGYDDLNDRIMHVLVRTRGYQTGQRFWFECGTNDEKDDRNHNGIIDSIEDTLDLITELKKNGYKEPEDIVYYEIENGEHNHRTWSAAMPVFLKWLVGL